MWRPEAEPPGVSDRRTFVVYVEAFVFHRLFLNSVRLLVESSDVLLFNHERHSSKPDDQHHRAVDYLNGGDHSRLPFCRRYVSEPNLCGYYLAVVEQLNDVLGRALELLNSSELSRREDLKRLKHASEPDPLRQESHDHEPDRVSPEELVLHVVHVVHQKESVLRELKCQTHSCDHLDVTAP